MAVVTHRKELREKRRHEAVHGKVWTDVTEADHVSYKEDTVVSDQNEYGYSKWGRGGYGWLNCVFCLSVNATFHHPWW